MNKNQLPTSKPTLTPTDALLYTLGLPPTEANRAAVEVYTAAIKREWIARLIADSRALARLHEQVLSKEY